MSSANDALRDALAKNLRDRASARSGTMQSAVSKETKMAKKSQKRVKGGEGTATATADGNADAESEPTTPESVKFDFKGYQKRLAQHAAVKEVSRNYLATLIGEPAT